MAVQAYQTVNADLPPENGILETFKDRIEIDSSGDLILIKARAEEPQLAAEIANAWARQTTQTINLAYSGEQPLPEIQTQTGNRPNRLPDRSTGAGDFQSGQPDFLPHQPGVCR